MDRSHAFETVLVLILIGLIGLLLLMIVATPQPAKGWEMQGNGSVDYMFTGSDDTLYVFQGNNVTAIHKDGHIAWSKDVSDRGRIINYQPNGYRTPVVDEADGILYLSIFCYPLVSQLSINSTDYRGYPAKINSRVIAISPDGTIAWEYQYTSNATVWASLCTDMINPNDIDLLDITFLQARFGHVFMLHNHQEDVLGNDGKLLFTLPNISNPVAIDEKGCIYAARTASIDAYGPDGVMLWSAATGENITGTYDDLSNYPPTHRSLPQYVSGTLYVPVDNGTAAIGMDGNIKWVRHLTRGSYVPFSTLPVDSRGYAYLMIPNQPGGYTYVCSISPEGIVNENAWRYETDTSTSPVARDDGTVYFITNNSLFPFEAFNSSTTDGPMTINTLKAYEISDNRVLWSFNVPGEDVYRLILNVSNVNVAMPEYNPNNILMNAEPGFYGGVPADVVQVLPIQNHRITINPGKNVVYLSYYSIMYESPIIFNRSRAVYVNSLYALDNNGTLLWKRPMDGFVTHVVARNDTFYYSTDGGKIGGNTVNAAAGIALIAAAYVFLRIFIVGTVARARTKIESNGNRNELLKFINENPGVTAVDISRGLKMNLGTIRYHLFILAANHKIVPHKDDGKFLRYFRNSGAYSPEERSWLSLLRREPIRKVIAALERNPGQSLQELARELDMSPTAVHNHISELSARGIVDREQGDERGFAYTIKEEYHPYIAKTMEML